MTTTDDRAFFVIPLSMQREGDHYYVGNAELDEFYQFPEQGVAIVHLLQSGKKVGEIKTMMARQSDEPVDVDEFIETLTDIGFIYPEGEQARFRERVTEQDDDDKRLVFRPNERLAKIVFSRPSLVVYLGIVGYALYSMIRDPMLRPSLDAFYLERNLTLTMLLLLVLYGVTASLHELGHILAAARQGVRSKLGIGNRLWNIVAEADMTGLLSLPREKRYLPLWAGMMVDLLSISIITLILKWLMANGSHALAMQLLQALTLQICISITWQFRIFLRTDVYYIVCNYYGYTNLNAQARTFYEHQLHRFSRGLLGRAEAQVKPEHIAIARTFFVIWIVGRIATIAFLLFVLVPTIWRYFVHAYDAFNTPYVSTAYAYDLAAFATISAALLGFGVYTWLKPSKARE